MKNKLLIIQPQPFGELIDSYKWCEYLRGEYKITLLCQKGNGMLDMPDVKIKCVKSFGNRTVRGAIFVIFCMINILFFKGKIMVVHFEHCEIFKYIFPYKKMILDIRTLSISKNDGIRQKQNCQIRNACKVFDIITVISEGVKNQINLPSKTFYILPLGADVISDVVKTYDELHLLYVGTFSGRDIDKTINAMSCFHNKHSEIPLTYDVIGSGFNNEAENFKSMIKNLHIENIVTIHGRLPYNKLKPFFDKCNIGISFVPITDYYDDQPPTKTFEYIGSGLFTIATATNENKKIINNENGMLISDTVEDLANALYELYMKRFTIEDNMVRNSLKEYSWENIVNLKLKPILLTNY